ncbi:hypothetical protein PR202_ga04276 [Eleusine coracana subsp. coracana]|uniref:Myb-like domain-containing protein n=1 Tax=Eleusine coracana subsp. coracana TaxID=191504 RepID=A0AAV5BPX0_ELECO|nr:hypothetical protein PR202_ga04276 [Eleusine coracana subsp. coracana]
MGANADPSGSLGGPHRHLPSPVPAPPQQQGVAASTVAALRHDPGLAVRWSPEEQALLDNGLAKYATDAAVVRYAKIAMSLPDKTVRDVALRCRWMAQHSCRHEPDQPVFEPDQSIRKEPTAPPLPLCAADRRKESNKKKKEELSKKNKEKKEKASDSSSKGPAHLVARPNAPPYTLPVLPMDDDDVSYKAIGGPTGQLLEHNAQILNQIYTNISNMQVQDNLSLLCQTRDNILTVLKEISDVPEIMRQMPPLPVKLNEDLANSMLPRPPGT